MKKGVSLKPTRTDPSAEAPKRAKTSDRLPDADRLGVAAQARPHRRPAPALSAFVTRTRLVRCHHDIRDVAKPLELLRDEADAEDRPRTRSHRFQLLEYAVDASAEQRRSADDLGGCRGTICSPERASLSRLGGAESGELQGPTEGEGSAAWRDRRLDGMEPRRDGGRVKPGRVSRVSRKKEGAPYPCLGGSRLRRRRDVCRGRPSNAWGTVIRSHETAYG